MKLSLLIILIFFLVTPAHAIHTEEGTTIAIVAAYSTPEGEAGILLNATVIVTEGNGHVFVDTQPYTQVDLQGSARIAALVASDITGIDPSKNDFYYIIEVTSPIIGGPSAGGALTVATIAEIENWKLQEGVVMTGMINLDGSIGPVGGIPYKLDAAAREGAHLFIVPEGQTQVVITQTEFVRRGPFIIRQENPTNIDVVDQGKNLNVEVVEAANIEDAVEFFTGKDIRKTIPKKGVWSAEYLEVQQPLARNVLDEANRLYAQANEESTHFPALLQSQQELLAKAQEQYNQQEYYSATNTGLLVMKNLKYILWSEQYQKAANRDSYLDSLYENVSQQINMRRLELERFKRGGVVDIDSVGAAEVRVVMAEQLLESSRSAASDDDFINILALAYMRAETVQWWLSLVNSNHITHNDTLRERAGWYVGSSSSVVIYAQTVISESGGFHGVSEILNEASDSLDRAQIEYDRGYYSGAIFDALRATVQASTAINLLGYADINTKINRSADAARIAIEDARAAGIEPVLAVSAYEFADSQESPSQKIVEYNYARVLAKTTMQLTESIGTTGNVSTATPIPLKTPGSLPTKHEEGTDVIVPGFSIMLAIFILLIAAWLRK